MRRRLDALIRSKRRAYWAAFMQKNLKTGSFVLLPCKYISSAPWSYYTHNTQNRTYNQVLKQISWLIMASRIQMFACLVILALLACSVEAQLSANFYSSSCPRLQTIVRNAMTQAVNGNRRTGASILRLFFHDCFVNVSITFLYDLLNIFLSHLHL